MADKYFLNVCKHEGGFFVDYLLNGARCTSRLPKNYDEAVDYVLRGAGEGHNTNEVIVVSRSDEKSVFMSTGQTMNVSIRGITELNATELREFKKMLDKKGSGMKFIVDTEAAGEPAGYRMKA
jgi:hypothetical protein